MSSPSRSSSPAALVAALDSAGAGRMLAGATLLERQLRALAAAGAARIVLLVENVPAEIASGVARLRGERVRVDLVQRLDQAAALLGQAERVVLLGEGCLPEAELVERLARATAPAVATLADDPALAAYERIDGTTRWAGVALLDGARLAETAAMVGDWDPVSTLMRRLVQEGAARVPAAAPPLLAADPDALANAERLLLASARRGRRGWARRWLDGPAADRLLPLLLERGVRAPALAWTASGAAALGGAVALAGWRWLPLVLLLVCSVATAAADQLEVLNGGARTGRAAARVRRGGGAAALVGLGLGLAAGQAQWGWLALALFGLLTLGTGHLADDLVRRLGGGAPPDWRARAEALPWVLLPFAVAGAWRTGLVALLLYALASIADAGRRLHALAPARA